MSAAQQKVWQQARETGNTTRAFTNVYGSGGAHKRHKTIELLWTTGKAQGVSNRARPTSHYWSLRLPPLPADWTSAVPKDGLEVKFRPQTLAFEGFVVTLGEHPTLRLELTPQAEVVLVVFQGGRTIPVKRLLSVQAPQPPASAFSNVAAFEKHAKKLMGDVALWDTEIKRKALFEQWDKRAEGTDLTFDTSTTEGKVARTRQKMKVNVRNMNARKRTERVSTSAAAEDSQSNDGAVAAGFIEGNI